MLIQTILFESSSLNHFITLITKIFVNVAASLHLNSYATEQCLFSLALIAGTSPQKSISARREQVPFNMAIGNGELMLECFPKHPRMGTAR